jgi:hypothetical protein
LLRGWYIAPSTIVWRTSAFLKIGGHNAALHINQDVDFLFRALTGGFGLVGTPGARARVREHEGLRQGRVSSAERLDQMLNIRRRFARDLRSCGHSSEANRRALAEYAFDAWAEWRIAAPEAAAGFLDLSRETWPSVAVRGGWLYRGLGALLGPANATIVKQQIQRIWQEDQTAMPSLRTPPE